MFYNIVYVIVIWSYPVFIQVNAHKYSIDNSFLWLRYNFNFYIVWLAYIHCLQDYMFCNDYIFYPQV